MSIQGQFQLLMPKNLKNTKQSQKKEVKRQRAKKMRNTITQGAELALTAAGMNPGIAKQVRSMINTVGKMTKNPKRNRNVSSGPQNQSMNSFTMPPVTINNKAVTKFKHRELFSTIYAPSSGAIGHNPFYLTSAAISPGNSGSFPYLSQIGQNFTKSRFTKLVFTYIPAISQMNLSGLIGSLILGMQYDVTAPNFTSIREMMDYGDGSTSRMCDPVTFKVDVRRNSRVYDWYFTPSNIFQLKDVLYSIGNFQYALVDSQFNSGQTLGELFVDYEVEFTEPRLWSWLGRSAGFCGIYLDKTTTGTSSVCSRSAPWMNPRFAKYSPATSIPLTFGDFNGDPTQFGTIFFPTWSVGKVFQLSWACTSTTVQPWTSFYFGKNNKIAWYTDVVKFTAKAPPTTPPSGTITPSSGAGYLYGDANQGFTCSCILTFQIIQATGTTGYNDYNPPSLVFAGTVNSAATFADVQFAFLELTELTNFAGNMQTDYVEVPDTFSLYAPAPAVESEPSMAYSTEYSSRAFIEDESDGVSIGSASSGRQRRR
jgi:hypothetical protein